MTRLEKIFSLVEKCGVFADIGCDHGKLCKAVLDDALAQTVIAADISAASLAKAEKLLHGYGNAEFYVSDGFEKIPKTVDCAVISGMGGREILKIINNRHIKTLILQPQNYIGGVRQRLCETGYGITKDEIVKEGGKFYFVIKAVFGDNQSVPTAAELEYGMFYKRKCVLLGEKLSADEKKYLSFKPTKENTDKLKIIREALLWQR